MQYRLPLTLTVLLAACSGSGSSQGPDVPVDPGQAPQFIGYSDPDASYELGAEITPNVPEVIGDNLSFTATPALPTGLIISPQTGIISGTPLKATVSAQYIVRATNPHGSANVQVKMTIPSASMYLNTSRPLVASDLSAAIPGQPVLGGKGSDQAGAAPQTGVPLQVDAPQPVDLDLVFLEDVPGLSFGYVPPYHDASSDFFSWIVPTYESLTFIAGWSVACTAPYASVPASLLGFGIGRSDLVPGESELAVSITWPGSPDPLVTSTSLPTRRMTVERLTRDIDLQDGWLEVAGTLVGIGEVAPGVTKLFRYDLATDELRQVSESAIGGGDDQVVLLGAADGRVFASMRKAAAGDTTHLFSYDVVTDTLLALTNIHAGNEDPSDLVISDNQVYFAASQASGARKLYRFDLGTNRLNQISATAGSGNDDPRETLVIDEQIYFTALDAGGNRHLYAYDTQADQVDRLSATAGAGNDDAPTSLTELDGVLYLTAAYANGARKLFHLDPVSNQLVQAVDFRGDATLSDDPQYLLAYDNDLFFRVQRADGVFKLHRYQPLQDRGELMSNTAGTGINDDLQDLTQIGTHIVFSSINEQGTRELYFFNDATGEVVRPIENMIDGDDNPTGFMHLGDGTGVLTMDGPDGDRELYFYDSQQRWVSRIADTSLGNDDATAQLVIDGDPYFLATDADGQRSLFRLVR